MVSGRSFSDVGEFSSLNSTPLRFVMSMKLADADAKAQASAQVLHSVTASVALVFTFCANGISQRCTAFLYREYPVRPDPFQVVYKSRRPSDRERVDGFGRP